VSYGPSGIGVVNLGGIKDLEVAATIVTHGVGARGFNVYLDFVEKATFERIVTDGDAAVGIQISQKVSKLVVRDDIQTRGGSGSSLVKGSSCNSLQWLSAWNRAGRSTRSIVAP